MSSHEQVTQEMRDAFDAVCKGRVEAAVKAEREACAQLCEDEICNCCWDEQAGAVAEHLAETIRARGNT